MLKSAYVALAGAVLLAGCDSGTRMGESTVTVVPIGPTILVAAEPKVVEAVILQRARARGAAPRVVAEGVLLERDLPSTTEPVAEVCGPHREGRKVRVLLTIAREGSATRVSESRAIIDVDKNCAFPLTDGDRLAAERSLNEMRVQAEAARAARR